MSFGKSGERQSAKVRIPHFPLFCVIVGLCALLSVLADGQLEPMAGAGGVIRDAERRALARPKPVKKDKSVPDVKQDSANVPSPIQKDVESKIVGPISNVRVFGSTAFAEKEGISGLMLDGLGSDGDKTVGEILKALQKVRARLLDRGFYLVRLTLARSGTYDKDRKTLSILVDEGRFGKVNVKFDGKEDGTWFSNSQIARRFKDVVEGETFDYRRVRSALFEANSHPDLVIDTSIDVRKPIEGEGNDRRVARYADLNLDVHESMPFHLLWSIDNYGLKDVNEWQTSLTAQYLNLTKHDDVLTFSPAMSFGAELFSCAASYMLPHEYWLGGNTTLYGGWSRVDVDDIIPSLDLEGTGYFLGLQHSENLYNTDRHQLSLSAGLLWRYIEDQYTVSHRSLNERGAHILPLSLALSYTGKKPDVLGGRNFATLQGVYNVMNAGDDLEQMWNGADENYWIFRWQLARLQPIFGSADATTEQTLHNWQLFVKVEGQYTDETLIPTEKLMLGGHNCLRGYRTRGYVGDYGVYGTFELRTPLLVDSFASLFGDRKDKVAFDRVQFLSFCDWGVARYNDLPSGYDDNEFLLSAGVGMRLAITKYSQLRCDVAFPCVDGNNKDDRDMEVYLAVQFQF